MLRTIVTSSTYRQSSRRLPDVPSGGRAAANSDDDAEPLDPNNLLLGRQARLRLEAEVIRDVALSTSGLLSPQVGGPSVHPPQAAGVFNFTQVISKPWKASEGPDRYRRGMYTFLWRSMPYPALTTFDFPNSNVTCTRRVRSNTPLQALTLANDPVFVECAVALGGRVLAQPLEDDDARIDWLYRQCLSREPTEVEQNQLQRFVVDQRIDFADQEEQAGDFAGRKSAPKDVVELATWASAARVMMNLDEFITRE